MPPPETPTGFLVTIEKIYNSVERIEKSLNEEITKLRVRIAAHEVVIGIMTIVVVFLTQKGLS